MKKILIVMALFGDGHRSPAYAIRDFIKQKYKDKFEVKVVDLARELEAFFFYNFYRGSWNYVVLKNLFFIKYIIKLGDTWFISRLVNGFFGIGLNRRLEKYINNEKPDIIVTTHYFFSQRLGALKKKGRLPVPYISINTDPYYAHYFWVDRECDYMVTFSGQAKNKLVQMRVNPDKIKIFNYPVNPRFENYDNGKQELRDKLNLRQKILTFILSAGAEGIGVMEKHIQFLRQKKLDIQFVVICGRNKRLYKKLLQQVNDFPGPPYIHIKGFINNMEEYLHAADFVVGKAGANVTFEALNLKKPVIHNAWTINEKSTMEFVVNNGLGFFAPKPHLLHKLIMKICKHRKILDDCAKRIADFGLKNGVAELADFIISIIK